MNGKRILPVLMALAGISFFVQAEEKGEAASIADKVTLSLEFNGSLISVDSEGGVDSMVGAGFNEDETKLGVAYEDELWGASGALKFDNQALRIIYSELAMFGSNSPLSIDELYAWVKPFGEHFKFTGGVFENFDGVADYTDDIDDFSLGVFVIGEDGEPFTEPEESSNAALTNGFLSEAIFGPLTVQLLLAPNFSKESVPGIAASLFDEEITVGKRLFRIGGRIIGEIEGIGTASAMVKTFQMPIEFVNTMFNAAGKEVSFSGTLMSFTTFGAYFDITAVENLGISLGYTGFLPYIDDTDNFDNILWNGIDLRATWTGIESLSLSTHHNISFAKGAEKMSIGGLGKDGSFFNLYNAIGATKELTEKFSVNAEIANVLTKIDMGGGNEASADHLFVGAKLITHLTENVEFDAGLALDVEINSSSGSDDQTRTVFSVPIAIKVSF